MLGEPDKRVSARRIRRLFVCSILTLAVGLLPTVSPPINPVTAETDASRVLVILSRWTTGPAPPAHADEKALLTEFAAEAGLRPVWIPYRSAGDIYRHLYRGAGDVIITGLEELEIHLTYPVQYTYPWGISSENARPKSWAVRAVTGGLHAALNRFLDKNHLKVHDATAYREDLPELQLRKVLRLITYPGPVNYYLDHGRLRGFEYELLKRFAKSRGMRLGVVVAGSHAEMAEMLALGRGDVVAAFLPRDSFSGSPGIAYTRHYGYTTPVVVGRTQDAPILDARDLRGKRVALPAESPYRSLLLRLRNAGLAFDLVEAPPGWDTAAVLDGVSRGEYDATVIGVHQVNSELAGRSNVKTHFALAEPDTCHWAVRTDAIALRLALDEYIAGEFRQAFYNTLAAKYIDHPTPGKDRWLLAYGDRLSPYDARVRVYAEQYGFDWRLIVAQMYQESRFDPAAMSTQGAVGLMQLTPETADLMGVRDLFNPDSSIQGGIRYLAYLRGRFEDDLLMEDRTWFTLAAYNAGYSRVQRARRLAARMGLDPDRWFDNVERGMLALSRPYRKDGELIQDCRCGQTAHYLREIRTLYNNYLRLTQAVRLASRDAGAGGTKEG